MYRTNGSYEFKEEIEPDRQVPTDGELNQLLEEFFGTDKKELKKFKNAIGK